MLGSWIFFPPFAVGCFVDMSKARTYCLYFITTSFHVARPTIEKVEYDCVCVCVVNIWVGVKATPKVYSRCTMKPAAPDRIILVTFPLRCSYWPGTSTSLFTPSMGQRYHPLNILNTFVPDSLRIRRLIWHVPPKLRQQNPLRRSAKL
jgi:hypothetical protein